MKKLLNIFLIILFSFSTLSQTKGEKVVVENNIMTIKSSHNKEKGGEIIESETFFIFHIIKDFEEMTLTIKTSKEEKVYWAMVVDRGDNYIDFMFREYNSKVKHFLRLWENNQISLLMNSKKQKTFY